MQISLSIQMHFKSFSLNEKEVPYVTKISLWIIYNKSLKTKIILRKKDDNS